MGTNYYLLTEVCEHCNRGVGEIHLGKSSGGWAFSFRGYHPNQPHDLPPSIEKVENIEEWRQLVNLPNSIVKDEYGDIEDKEEFIKWTGAKEGKHHAQYMEGHEYQRYFDDVMVDGHSFSFQEFS